MEFTVITVINQICCDPTQCPAVCVRSTPIPHIPYLRRETCAANLCDPSSPSPRSGTPLERGSDKAAEGKGRLRRRISNAREQDRWRRLQWKQHVFTSQGISNSFFHHVLWICLVAMAQCLPEAGEDSKDGGSYCLPLVLILWHVCLWFGYWSHHLMSQLRSFMLCFFL